MPIFNLEDRLYLKRVFYLVIVISVTLVPFMIYVEYKRNENLKITVTIKAKITCVKKHVKLSRNHLCLEYEYDGVIYHKQVSNNFEISVYTGDCIQIFVSKKEPNTIKANYTLGTIDCR